MKTGKVITLLLVLITISASLNAQEKELYIQYKYNRKDSKGLLRSENSFMWESEIELFSYGNKMVSRKNNLISNKEDANGNVISCDTLYYYTVIDYSKGHLLLSEDLPRGRGVQYLLKEPLNLFEWRPSVDTKTILGYTCHKATCSFRGREYVAWFTRDIPFKAAPWKFHGLPGAILEVYPTDGYCSWVAESVEIRPYKKEIELPFYGIDIVDLKKYMQILKKKKQVALKGAEIFGFSEEQISMSTRSIEIFDLD
ncbi:GLPGLI family protein [Marinifilum sp.]|uniref:GLPGLI family protein n=1 Tax=Marinifilum sp. TaxID=2033137 RepID=UPI003BAD25D3